MIYQGVSVNIFPRLLGAQTSKAAWDLLNDEYKGDLKVMELKLQDV